MMKKCGNGMGREREAVSTTFTNGDRLVGPKIGLMHRTCFQSLCSVLSSTNLACTRIRSPSLANTSTAAKREYFIGYTKH